MFALVKCPKILPIHSTTAIVPYKPDDHHLSEFKQRSVFVAFSQTLSSSPAPSTPPVAFFQSYNLGEMRREDL